MTFDRQTQISFGVVVVTATLLLSYLLLLGCASQYTVLDSFFRWSENFLGKIGIVLFLCLLGGMVGIVSAGGDWFRRREFLYHSLYEIVFGVALLSIFIAFLYPFLTRGLVIKGTNALVYSEFRELGVMANNYQQAHGGSYDGFCESPSFQSAQSALSAIDTHEGALCASTRVVTCRTNGTEFALSVSNSFAGPQHVYLCLDAQNTDPIGSVLPVVGTRCEEI